MNTGRSFLLNSTAQKTLDRAAVSMAVICGIHCLVTPVLLVALPIIATSFWVDENFHLCMLLLVIPTTTLAVWSGCRRHRDRWVVIFAIVGLSILVSALIAERWEHSHEQEVFQSELPATQSSSELHPPGGGCCQLHPPRDDSGDVAASKSIPRTWHALLNTLGGCFLVAGHARNFALCRKDKCSHGKTCCAGR